MKKFIIILFLVLFFVPISYAQSSSFKTFTPINPHYGYNYRKHLPPTYNNYTNQQNRYWKRRNRNNYRYNSPYYTYYPQKHSVFTSIGDLFNGGKITGYTDSNFDDIDIPYGYQEGYQDENGNYYQKNYGYQSGSSIKILD